MVATRRIRLAQYNIQDLSTAKLCDVDSQGVGLCPQICAAAEIVRRVRPDILAINEIDHDYSTPGAALDRNLLRFRDAYLAGSDAKPSNEGAPLGFEFAFAEECNTGFLSGFDLNFDGQTSTENDRGTHEYALDCWGYGHYPGHYSLGLLSRFPILHKKARTFRKFRWADLTGNHLPMDELPPGSPEVIPLSSKSHWDTPISVDGAEFHIMMAHPTPAGFAVGTDRVRARNFDEIKFWANYLDGEGSVYDDRGGRGGFTGDAPFAIMGDMNAGPNAHVEGYDGVTAIEQLLKHPKLQDTGSYLTSSGAAEYGKPGPPDHPERHTIHHPESNSRFDYILPSQDVRVLDGGVFWPSPKEDPVGAALADEASDHRLIWLDVEIRLNASPSDRKQD